MPHRACRVFSDSHRLLGQESVCDGRPGSLGTCRPCFSNSDLGGKASKNLEKRWNRIGGVFIDLGWPLLLITYPACRLRPARFESAWWRKAR